MAGTSAAPMAMRARCRFCGQWRDPREFVHGALVGYCWRCLEWHAHALELLRSGAPARGCQECGRDYAALEAMTAGADVRFGLHRKDGVWQVLGVACGCSDAYERKRLDMYGSTPYGERKKLKGAK